MTEYRYTLTRETGLLEGRGVGVFVMLNPSTADEHVDDPTIRRCRGFAAREGWAVLRVVNLYAARATEPLNLARLPDPVGPENIRAASLAIMSAHTVVAAWGSTDPGFANPEFCPRTVFSWLLQAIPDPVAWKCLGVTASGAPRHPLYVPASQPLLDWNHADWRA